MAEDIEALGYEVHRAGENVDEVREKWGALFAAFELRTHAQSCVADAHAKLAEAQRKCRVAAEKLGIRTLPLSGDALAQLRADAEAQADARLTQAHQVYRAAQAVQRKEIS